MKRVKNTGGKGEIAHYEQFLLFPQHFLRLVVLTRENQGLHGKGLTFTAQSRLLTYLRKEAFENILGKGENAGNQHFLLFPKCFLPSPTQISIFELPLFCCLQMPLHLD